MAAPFAERRRHMIERIREIFSTDSRFLAGWLEGSLADGSADDYSDIDLHLCVAADAWDSVWNRRLAVIEEIAPIIASLDIMGIFAVGCLMEGPVKLDVFFERESDLGSRPRAAIVQLWGPSELLARLRTGDDIPDAAIAHTLQTMVLGLMQGGAWPVRILAREQTTTFLYGEILLIETAIVPLVLLQTDRRALHRNMFTRLKLLPPESRVEIDRLANQVIDAVGANDREAMLRLHLVIFHRICALAREAFQRFGLAFPPRAEAELAAFYQREWPRS